MEARAGDRIVVRSAHQGEPDRSGEVREVRGPAGAPPYLVRWAPDGHEGLFYPGGSCVVLHDVPAPDDMAAPDMVAPDAVRG